MKRLLNTVLIFMILMVFMFIGVNSVMAFNSSMAVNQSGSYLECLSPISTSTLNHLEAERPFNYKNTETFAATLPTPTYHMGKIHRLWPLSYNGRNLQSDIT